MTLLRRRFYAPPVNPHIHRHGFNEQFVDYDEIIARFPPDQRVNRTWLNDCFADLGYVMKVWKKMRFALRGAVLYHNCVVMNQHAPRTGRGAKRGIPNIRTVAPTYYLD